MEAVRIIAVLAIGIGLPAAQTAKSEAQVKEIKFSAPYYELAIHRDGTVEYKGESDVKEKGYKTSKISKNDFHKLVRKIYEIRFFDLEDRYDSYHLEPPAKPQHEKTRDSQAAANEATAGGITVTDLPSKIVTVITTNRTKSVDDRLGAPKGLFELEWLVLDVTHASQWIGSLDDVRDVPYYDSFEKNKRVTYRALLQSYRRSTDRNAPVAGYDLQLINNPGIDFELRIAATINLQEFDGWIVDATGKITETEMAEPQFVVTNIRRVRKYLPLRVQKR